MANDVRGSVQQIRTISVERLMYVALPSQSSDFNRVYGRSQHKKCQVVCQRFAARRATRRNWANVHGSPALTWAMFPKRRNKAELQFCRQSRSVQGRPPVLPPELVGVIKDIERRHQKTPFSTASSRFRHRLSAPCSSPLSASAGSSPPFQGNRGPTSSFGNIIVPSAKTAVMKSWHSLPQSPPSFCGSDDRNRMKARRLVWHAGLDG